LIEAVLIVPVGVAVTVGEIHSFRFQTTFNIYVIYQGSNVASFIAIINYANFLYGVLAPGSFFLAAK
jgi:hypothetical protein